MSNVKSIVRGAIITVNNIMKKALGVSKARELKVKDHIVFKYMREEQIAIDGLVKIKCNLLNI